MSEIVVCTFRVAAEKREAFRELLKAHWPVLRELGLALEGPHLVLESLEESTFVEIFAWRDAAAVESAHHDPKVRAVWDQMTPLCEAREGRPPMEFPHFKEI